MPSTAIARANEPLDLICWRVLGTTDSGVLEAAMNLNPGLADKGALIAEGTAVRLPDPPSADANRLETVNLWD